MEQDTPLDQDRYLLESQVRELFGRVAYSHKTQEKMADRFANYQRRIKLWQVILSALTASGVISTLFTDVVLINYATALVSLLTLILSGYAKDIDPGAAAQQHRQTASDIWNVREMYLSLLIDIRDYELPIKILKDKRDAIQAHLYKIYRAAPNTDVNAYVTAQKALKRDEELTFSDQEIDILLPKNLRRTRR